MNLHKKCVANDRRCASRDKGQHSSMSVGQAVRANSSEIMPGAPRAGRLTFVDDFTREHTHPDLHLASIEISGIF